MLEFIYLHYTLVSSIGYILFNHLQKERLFLNIPSFTQLISYYQYFYAYLLSPNLLEYQVVYFQMHHHLILK